VPASANHRKEAPDAPSIRDVVASGIGHSSRNGRARLPSIVGVFAFIKHFVNTSGSVPWQRRGGGAECDTASKVPRRCARVPNA
jgi:hypothetical protein